MPHKSAPNNPLGGFNDIFNSLICCQSNDQPQQKRNLSLKKPKYASASHQYYHRLSSPPPSAASKNPDYLPLIYTQNFLTPQNSNLASHSDQVIKSSDELATPKMSLSLSEQRPLDKTSPATSSSFLSQAIETSLTPSAMTFNYSQSTLIQPPTPAPNRQTKANQAIEISSTPTKGRVVGEMTI